MSTTHLHRQALHQLAKGTSSVELCVPCQLAIYDTGIDSIGTKAWLNNGFPDCEGLDKPAVYCCLCRHIIRARAHAEKQGITSDYTSAIPDWFLVTMEQGIFIHADGWDLDVGNSAALSTFDVSPDDHVRSIQAETANLSLIKSWIHDCEHDHGGTCGSQAIPESPTGQAELLLLDLHQDCLVRGSFGSRYFALSYVWGTGSTQYLTLKENFDMLLEPGSLAGLPITQTIRDAMTLVLGLNERFLWVDTMCIVQDDYEGKQVQINQMAAIYKRAVAIIIAITGDSADAGLPGVTPTLRNTNATPIAPGLAMVERMSLDRAMHEYKYGERAWTFQERLLSTRSIIFTEEMVYFQCQTTLWCEDRYGTDRWYTDTLFTLDKAKRNVETARKGYKHALPDEFKHYADFMAEYTAKQMGFPSDILNAFVGISMEFTDTFHWTFACGLPKELIELSLLWTPVKSITRRKTTDYYPSWSWAGWVGESHYKDMVRPLPNHSIKQSFISCIDACKFDSLDGKKEDILQFVADVSPTDQFTIKKCIKQLYNPYLDLVVTADSYFLYDAQGRRCGVLYGTGDEEGIKDRWGDTKEPLLLVVLSIWRRANSTMCHGPMIRFWDSENFSASNDEELFDKTYQDTEFVTHNVMLLEPWGKHYRRLAVGQMHREAWWKSEAIKIGISLV